MKKVVTIMVLVGMVMSFSSPGLAVEVAPRISDREIIESLVGLRGDIKALRAEIQGEINALKNDIKANAKAIKQLRADMSRQISQLRTDMNTQISQLRTDMGTQINRLRTDMNTQNKQLRVDMNTQISQLRADMNAQFTRMINMMVGIVLAFAGIVAATIGFAIWDRRTMIRPFETKVKEIEDELAENRTILRSLIDVLRNLSKTDEKLAEVLKRFNLL
jgi:chromosome segregation ATPase